MASCERVHFDSAHLSYRTSYPPASLKWPKASQEDLAQLTIVRDDREQLGIKGGVNADLVQTKL